MVKETRQKISCIYQENIMHKRKQEAKPKKKNQLPCMQMTFSKGVTIML
jgi:hypothetical protein